MSKDDHFIFTFEDENDRLVNFERFKLKTLNGAYKSLLTFIKRYGLKNYFYSSKKQPIKLIASYQAYEPNTEVIHFVKSYDEFLKDLQTL